MSILPTRLRAANPATLLLFAILALALLSLSGCKHMPPIEANMNMKAQARTVSESATPGNSGPVQAFTVPKADAGMGGPAVAVIDVDGVLLNMDMVGPGSAGENPVSLFRERLEAAAADPCTRAVVIRINSPGGGVTATDIMWHDLQRFKSVTRLPVVVCLMDLGAGGGYYLATAGDTIVAHPTTVTGGIGVILNLYNLQRFMEERNVVGVPIKSGPNIDAGTPIKDATDEQREMLQTMANQYHERFKEVVLRARPMIDPAIASTFDGRVFTATQAVNLHLIDSIGYLDDAVEAARNMAGIANARVVLYHRCNDRARTQYSITPNVPIQGEVMPVSFPGLERASMPTFLYLWQPEPMMEKLGGR